VWIGIAELVVLGAALFASVRGRITATGVIDEIEARDEEADR
jgi:hypothetical protein